MKVSFNSSYIQPSSTQELKPAFDPKMILGSKDSKNLDQSEIRSTQFENLDDADNYARGVRVEPGRLGKPGVAAIVHGFLDPREGDSNHRSYVVLQGPIQGGMLGVRFQTADEVEGQLRTTAQSLFPDRDTKDY